jgi:hypothetical protein
MRSMRLKLLVSIVLIAVSAAVAAPGRAAGEAFTISDDVTTESSSSVCSVTVTLSPASAGLTSVGYKTESGVGERRAKKATIREDFQYQEGYLDFAPGVTSQTINVQIKGDNFNEKPARKEFFNVNLFDPAGGATIADGEGVCTIVEQRNG